MSFDIEKIRSDFPILSREIHGKPLVYFDNAATTQKPLSVIEKMNQYYAFENANIHRGAYLLAHEATELYENARKRVASFINAKKSSEIIFTKGTTESINLIAFSFSERFLEKNDEVIISAMEHHANIVPWQMACERKKAHLKVIPMDKKGVLLLEKLPELISKKTKIIAISHVSNALGTINSIKEIIEMAHSHHIPVLIDGAQSISHQIIDVQKLDCDFFCFSAHKMYAPMGIGVLFGKDHWLNEIPPYQGGGEMIRKVTFSKTTYNELPFRFEAGTPNVAGAVGLHAAIDYMENVGFENITMQENDVLHYATQKLSEFDNIQIVGESEKKSGLISFVIKGIHPYDIGAILDHLGVAVRTGHHCAEPVLDFFGLSSTVRASFSFYNTREEVDIFISALQKAKVMLS